MSVVRIDGCLGGYASSHIYETDSVFPVCGDRTVKYPQREVDSPGVSQHLPLVIMDLIIGDKMFYTPLTWRRVPAKVVSNSDHWYAELSITKMACG